MTLQVGAATEEVTVSADATLLRTESSDLTHIIPAQRLNELPILGIGGNATTQGLRIFLSQTKLIPGAYYPDGGLTVKVNGAPTNTQSVRIEGYWGLSRRFNQAVHSFRVLKPSEKSLNVAFVPPRIKARPYTFALDCYYIAENDFHL